jgi:hypothetical protein
VLKVPGSSVEGTFGAGGTVALPKFTEATFFFQGASDVRGAVAKVGRGRRVGGGGPASPLDGVGKEGDSSFDVFRGF